MPTGRFAGLRVLNVHNVATHYRAGLFRELHGRCLQQVVFFQGPKRWREARNQEERTGFDARVLTGSTLRRWLALAHVVATGDYDLVVATFNGKIEPTLCLVAARLRGKPAVLWHGVWDVPRTPLWRLATPLLPRFFRSWDAVLTYGEHTRRVLIAFGVPPSRIVIAPQTVDPVMHGRAVPPADRDALRASWTLGEAKAALFVGRLVPEKGLPDLVTAIERLRGRWKLVAVGEGPLKERLHGVGYVPTKDLPTWFAAADALVLPSVTTRDFREPWGLVVNEAMHQALPVVTTDAVGAAIGGLAEHGKSALVVPEHDPEALADALERLASQRGLAERLGDEGRRRVRTMTYAKMADRFEQAFELAMRRGATAEHSPPASQLSLSFDELRAEHVELARLLARLGLRATFFVSVGDLDRRTVEPGHLRDLAAMGFEIGSLGLENQRLDRMSERAARRELFLSKQRLEDVLDRPVRGFCLPDGRWHRLLPQWVAQAGYDYCRTTAMFRRDHMREGNLLHTSLELGPLRTYDYARNVLRQRSVDAARGFLRTSGSRVEALLRAYSGHGPLHFFARAPRVGGSPLESILRRLADDPSPRATNAELFDALVGDDTAR